MKLFSSVVCIAFFWLTLPVSVKNFKPAFGKWKGTLTYLDYTSGKPYTMPANITIKAGEDNSRKLIFIYEYPDEPKANETDTIAISNSGEMLDGAMVQSKKKSKGMLEIITDENGKDGNDNKKAVIRHVYSIGKKIFSIRKEVKFEGEEKWILRNEYKMKR